MSNLFGYLLSLLITTSEGGFFSMKIFQWPVLGVLLLSCLTIGLGQSTTASLSGTVADEKQAVIAGATVVVRNVNTGFSRTAQSDGEGRFRFVNLPLGAYQVRVEAPNFTTYVQEGITLVVNQNAVIDATLKAGGVEEIVSVTENASVLNVTTAEVSTRFDERRLSELPIATNRNVFNVLLSVPGVSQLGSGQAAFANGVSFSANGGRIRSNNFMLDGQDINDPSVSGGQIQLNNPDAIQEVRIITNQFLAENGRNSSSVINFVGKSGTNDFHGSLFWFHNNKKLNACSNLEKASGNCNPNAPTEARKVAPFRLENQIGFTLGGPLHLPWFGEGTPYFRSGKDRTFFFVDYQRWTDRALGSGFTLNGAPTEAGRQVLQSVVGNRPQIQALLRFVQPGVANGSSANFTVAGTTYTVPLGNLTGSSAFTFNDNQGSFRIDHRINGKNFIYGRYRWDSATTAGTGQVTPAGLTTQNLLKTSASTIVLNSILSSRMTNELRLAYSRYDSNTNASDPSSETIPSIEIEELGMRGFNAAGNRTAIGLGVNLPQFRINNTYQITDSLSYSTGNHNMKFGVDWRKLEVKSFFFPTVRGRLAYSTLQQYVDDFASLAATVNRPIPGGDTIGFYHWNEIYFYGQDQWKITPNFTLTYGMRYERPGNSFAYLYELEKRVLPNNGNSAFTPRPKADNNNFMPRIGFNWNPRTSDDGIIGFITGGNKLVIRGGYTRSYDASFININLNVFSSFPFVNAGNVAAAGAFAAIANFVPSLANPNRLTRTVVGEDFRAPAADQFSLEFQRELTADSIFKISYIGTRGTGLFQTIDGNPRRANVTTASCVSFGAANPNDSCRVDPTRGVIRLRANAASSTYHSMQTSFEKRLSKGFSGGVHYTWSSFIDTASEIFNPSGGEVAVSQDSFNRNSDRARSSFDRPHRITGNVVYEFPFYRSQPGFVGRVLGGWQINSSFTIQSGSPFTVLNGSDPAGALSGIDGLVGSAIRPNLVSGVNLSGMSIPEVRNACGTPTTTPVNRCPNLFSVTTAAQRVGNAGRNILRADSIENLDFGIIKNTQITERARFQIRVDMFNALNHRNFGVPNAAINSAAFLNQWATDGGKRRIIIGGRLVF
jgi:hypothetical protein